MIKIGSRIRFDWDEYDTYYNTDVQYIGTTTKEGVVVDFEDTPYQNKLKKEGLLKVIVNEISYGKYKDKTYYILKNDKSIIELTLLNRIKTFIKRLLHIKIIIKY